MSLADRLIRVSSPGGRLLLVRRGRVRVWGFVRRRRFQRPSSPARQRGRAQRHAQRGGAQRTQPRTAAPDMNKNRRLNETLGGELRISLGLVDLSRTPAGTFFREVHPGSEMAGQNDQNEK